MNITPMTEWRIMDNDDFEIEAERRELERHYLTARNGVWTAIDALRKIESDYGFEYPESINSLKELVKQLRVDQQTCLEFIESMGE
jgi:hypothetical protein